MKKKEKKTRTRNEQTKAWRRRKGSLASVEKRKKDRSEDRTAHKKREPDPHIKKKDP